MKKNLSVYVTTALLLIADLVSKHVWYNQQFRSEKMFITPVLNTWISRSLPVPIIVSSLVGIWAIVFFFWLFQTKKLWWFAVSLLLAGTIGNVFDRIAFGWVRDFININLFNFPIFNLADIFLTGWIILGLIKEISTWKNTEKK